MIELKENCLEYSFFIPTVVSQVWGISYFIDSGDLLLSNDRRVHKFFHV